MNEMKLFNVFGSLTATRTKVAVLATTVKPDGTAIEKSVMQHSDQPIDNIAEGEHVLIIFAARVPDQGRAEIAVQQLTREAGGPDVFGSPQVQNALRAVIKKFDELKR